jgi:hypothetical protein
MTGLVSVFAGRRVVEESSGEIGDVVCFASSTGSEEFSCSSLVTNPPTMWLSLDLPDSFVAFDFLSDPVIVSGYRLSFPEFQSIPGAFSPREISIDVSNDGNCWDIIVQTQVDGLRAEGQISPALQRIARFVRISQVGKNRVETDTFGLASVDLLSKVYTTFE